MSKMGQTISDIESRYFNGQNVDEIAMATRSSKSFVEGIVEGVERDTQDDYPGDYYEQDQ